MAQASEQGAVHGGQVASWCLHRGLHKDTRLSQAGPSLLALHMCTPRSVRPCGAARDRRWGRGTSCPQADPGHHLTTLYSTRLSLSPCRPGNLASLLPGPPALLSTRSCSAGGIVEELTSILSHKQTISQSDIIKTTLGHRTAPAPLSVSQTWEAPGGRRALTFRRRGRSSGLLPASSSSSSSCRNRSVGRMPWAYFLVISTKSSSAM